MRPTRSRIVIRNANLPSSGPRFVSASQVPRQIRLLEDALGTAEREIQELRQKKRALRDDLRISDAVNKIKMMAGQENGAPQNQGNGQPEAHRREELSPRELGVRLGLRPRSVHELLRTNQLPGYKVGRLWRVDEADFQAWVESQKRGVDKDGITVIPSRYDETRSPARQKGSRALAIEVRRAPGRAQVDGPPVGSGALPRKRARRAPHPVGRQAAKGPGEA